MNYSQTKTRRVHAAPASSRPQTRRLALTALGCVVGLASACGGGDSDLMGASALTCGPGTVEKDGQCVPSQDAAADTQTTDAPSEVGPEAGADVVPDAASESNDVSTAEDATQDSQSEAGDAETDSGYPPPHLGDDPCPTGEMLANCSDSCGPTHPYCDQAVCYGGFTATTIDQFPVVVRMPSEPGWSDKCLAACPPVWKYRPAYGFIVRSDLVGDPSIGKHQWGLRARIDPPWGVRIIDPKSTVQFCGMDDVQPESCVVSQNDSPVYFVVDTLDPDAPARNLVIERVMTPVECP